MTITALQATWFMLVGVLFTGFAILDGFDLGVGFWHLRAKGDDERRSLLNAVGPVWDGNEVWLLTGGGALFAAFPPVYASVFSGFYLALMLVVLMLITRAVSLEFRSKLESPSWRRIWDGAFSVSSTVAALLFGVALGNVLRGILLDAQGNYTGTFLDLLNPYALLIGVLGLAMLAFHGANFAALKTGGELAARARRWSIGAGIAYAALFVVAAATTLATQPHLLENFGATPVLWAIPALALGAIVAGLLFAQRGRAGRAFLASAVSIAAQLGLVGAGLFPRLVPALGDPALSLTAANSSSSEKTLGVMLVLALVGMPFVLGYTVWAYRAFRGKVDVSHEANHY
jgi:cytochrome d ubiquinol oxidase subunit II